MERLYGNLRTLLKTHDFDALIHFCYNKEHFSQSSMQIFQIFGKLEIQELGQYACNLVEYNDKPIKLVSLFVRHSNDKLNCDVDYESLRDASFRLKSDEILDNLKVSILNDDQDYNDWFAIESSVHQFFPQASIIIFDKYQREES